MFSMTREKFMASWSNFKYAIQYIYVIFCLQSKVLKTIMIAQWGFTEHSEDSLYYVHQVYVLKIVRKFYFVITAELSTYGLAFLQNILNSWISCGNGIAKKFKS